jgi:hypothetical protein
MIQDLCRVPAGIARLQSEPEAVFDEYGLSEEERAALRSGDPSRMVVGANAHPILAMHYLFVVNPKVLEQMSILGYPELFEGE